MLPKHLFQNWVGFLNDRRLRADGFIIRAQAAIRTDGFSVRAGLSNTGALRAPPSLVVRIQLIRKRSEVLQVKTISHALAASLVNFEKHSKQTAAGSADRHRKTAAGRRCHSGAS